jgi:DNA-binding winged helix-turn-helix (wHTH) protein
MQRIWSGEATAEEALPQICEEVNSFLAANGYGG